MNATECETHRAERQPHGAGAHPERVVALRGASNFRDLGGYRTRDGRQLRWRLLYRSDQLATLTAQDVAQLRARNISRALDFRGVAESTEAAYAWPGLARHDLGIEPSVVQGIRSVLDAGAELTPQHTVLLMQQTYRHFVTDCQAQYRALFAHLLAGDGPLVFHCTAGKDRTGFAAALILHALGVSRQQIMNDYLLTNRLYRLPARHHSDLSAEVLHVLWRVQPDFLQAARCAVAEHYGDMDAYLEQALGLASAARRRLEELYLRPVA